ncbi:hypothetical protein [Spiroplasma turonicum]|nr:hypothetical protein [Spiroplasma turonicum]
MTAEEILLNCEKHFSFISNEIDSIINYVKKLLENCKKINNSDFYENKIDELIKKLIYEKEDFKNSTINRKLEKDTHIAIETYNEIQKLAERKRDLLVELKFQAFALKNDIVQKEQELIFKSLNINKDYGLKDLENTLINSQNDDYKKVKIQNYFANKKEILVNKSHEQIIELVNQELNTSETNEDILRKELVSNAIDLYKNDKESLDILKEEINKLQTNNVQDLKKVFKDFLYKAEKETIRRDNINKIVEAIKSIGYFVDENNIRKIKEKNIVLIHAVKEDGKSADFAVKFDGSIIYNWEGFENHEHDEDAKAFLEKLRGFNIKHSEEYKKVYRKPDFDKVERTKLIIKKQKKGS